MKLNIRQSASVGRLDRFPAVGECLRGQSARVVLLPLTKRCKAQTRHCIVTSPCVDPLKGLRQEQFEEDLVFAALGLGGAAGVIAAFVSAFC